MQRLILSVGHLGSGPGVVSSLHDEKEDNPTIANPEERWSNLQQTLGFLTAFWTQKQLNPMQYQDVILLLPENVYPEMSKEFNIHRHKEDISLEEKVEIINELDGLCIEFHNNAASEKAKGFEILCFSRHDRNGKPSISFQMAKYMCQNFMNDFSKDFRNREVKAIYERETKKYIGRKLYLLRKTKNPTIIIESGFMTNQEDFKKIDVDLDGWNNLIGANLFVGYFKWYQHLLFSKSQEVKVNDETPIS
jgi:hypothetical protein